MGYWSLSGDGRRIAFIENKDQGHGELKILDRNTGSVKQVPLDQSTLNDGYLQTLTWLPNGKGLYLTAFFSSGTRLFAISLDGKAKTLFQHGRDWICCPKVAPDGRHLSITVREFQRDIALVENL